MSNTLNLNKLNKAINNIKSSKLLIASDCGISRVTLDNLLKGKEIGLYKFLKVIDFLGINVGYFFDEEIKIEEYNSHGDRAISAKTIENIDQRNYYEQNSFKNEIEEKDKTILKLSQRVDELQNELLEARAEIISLMKQK